MKRAGITASIVLNVGLVLVILGHFAIQAFNRQLGPEKPRVIVTSSSPDGKWRCVVTDIDPERTQCTAIFRISPVPGSPLPGTPYVIYTDSAAPMPQFEWSEGHLVIRNVVTEELVAEFDTKHQSWRVVQESGGTTKPGSTTQPGGISP